MTTVDVVLAHPWTAPDGKSHEVGERVSLDVALAERVVTGGTARYATKADAREAGAPESQARTAKK